MRVNMQLFYETPNTKYSVFEIIIFAIIFTY